MFSPRFNLLLFEYSNSMHMSLPSPRRPAPKEFIYQKIVIFSAPMCVKW